MDQLEIKLEDRIVFALISSLVKTPDHEGNDFFFSTEGFYSQVASSQPEMESTWLQMLFSFLRCSE